MTPPIVARPRFATPRDPSRTTFGPAVRKILALGGTPAMPWQSEGLDVALEQTDGGRFAYRVVVWTVPRQNGKTLPARGVLAHRMMARPAQQALGVAQSRQDAFRGLFEPVADLVARRGPLGALKANVRRANGSERVLLPNRSRMEIVAPTESAIHGLSLDLAFVDEAWHFTDDRLADSIEPAMLATPDPQLWIVSTAGTAESSYLRRWVELGRSGADPTVAYLDYSAADDDDPADPAVWARCNPAVGYTQSLETIGHLHASMPLASFERAVLNRWTFTLDHALPPAWWARAADTDAAIVDRVGRVDIACDVSADRSASAICLAGPDVTGEARTVLELVDYHPGTDWLVPRLADLHRRWRPPGGLMLDAIGPAATVADELTRRRIPYRAVTAGQLAAACAGLFDALRDETVAHRGQEELDAAAANAVRRPLLDRWAFARAKSPTDIAPLVAATLARYATATRPDRPATLVRSAPPA